ncbi:tetratricopeptide repeat protein [Flavicella sp.]|uniref:tetratricopeptide repeat protein n=1 Tax=Flavicella sp. TaxID=2957742 RepID=UPI0026378B0F|nr:tetratricopeptide repeat protein [Flavicella sp.]MDG1804323.1 tetratricopeptide repeat protein [Flavicella sp.]MDG2280791.1 tetratricopeptide repeat protein [Flavicella sp.]
MKILHYVVFCLLCFSMKAQQDSIVQQRLARSFVREGNALYEAEKYGDAAIAYKKATAQAGTYFKSSFNLGNALYAQKNYKEAVPQYELAATGTENKLEKAAAYHNIGNAHLQEKEYSKAIEAYKKSLRNNPSDDETRYNLAFAREKLKQQQEDDKKNNPPPPSDYAKRMKKKADNLLEGNQFEEVLKLMEAALEKDPTVANYKDFMQRIESVIEIKTK